MDDSLDTSSILVRSTIEHTANFGGVFFRSGYVKLRDVQAPNLVVCISIYKKGYLPIWEISFYFLLLWDYWGCFCCLSGCVDDKLDRGDIEDVVFRAVFLCRDGDAVGAFEIDLDGGGGIRLYGILSRDVHIIIAGCGYHSGFAVIAAARPDGRVTVSDTDVTAIVGYVSGDDDSGNVLCQFDRDASGDARGSKL